MAPTVKLYGWAVSPFVAHPLLCLEEAGVEYELVLMSREAGDHRQPDFLALNPFESRSIARHVLRKHKPELLGSGSLEAEAMVDVWLEVKAHQYHPAAHAIVVQCIISPLLGGVHDQAAVDENIGKLRKVLEVYEARLSASRCLIGDAISLADLSHFPIMRYFMETEYASLVEELPHIKAWWEGLKAKPAARKVAEFMPPDLGLGKKAGQ